MRSSTSSRSTSNSRRRSKLQEFASRRSRSITRRTDPNSTSGSSSTHQHQNKPLASTSKAKAASKTSSTSKATSTSNQSQSSHSHSYTKSQSQSQSSHPSTRDSSPANIHIDTDTLSLDDCDSSSGPPPLSLASSASVSYTTRSGSSGFSGFTSLSTATSIKGRVKDDSELQSHVNMAMHNMGRENDGHGHGSGMGIGMGPGSNSGSGLSSGQTSTSHSNTSDHAQPNRQRPHSANSIASFLSTVTSHTAEATQLMKEHFTLCGANRKGENGSGYGNGNGSGGGGGGGGPRKSGSSGRLDSFFHGNANRHQYHEHHHEQNNTNYSYHYGGDAYFDSSERSRDRDRDQPLHMDALYLSDGTGDDTFSRFSGSTTALSDIPPPKVVGSEVVHSTKEDGNPSDMDAGSGTASGSTIPLQKMKSLPASKCHDLNYDNLFPDSQIKRSVSTPTVLQSRAGSAFGRVSSTISDNSHMRSSTVGAAGNGTSGTGAGSSSWNYKSAFAPVGSTKLLNRSIHREDTPTGTSNKSNSKGSTPTPIEDGASIVSKDDESSVVSRDLSTAMSAKAQRKIKSRRRKLRDKKPSSSNSGEGMDDGQSHRSTSNSIENRSAYGKVMKEAVTAVELPLHDDVVGEDVKDAEADVDTFHKLVEDVQTNISLLTIGSEDANTKSQSLSDSEFASGQTESPSPSAYQKISDEEHSHGPSPGVGSRPSSARSKYRNMNRLSPISPLSRAVTPQPELELPQQKIMMQEHMSPCSQDDSCSNSRITTQSNNTCNQTLCTFHSGNRSVTSSVAADREVRETIRRQRKKREGNDTDGCKSVHSSDSNNSNPRAYFSLSSSPAPLRDGANMPVDKFFSHNDVGLSPYKSLPNTLSSTIGEEIPSIDLGSSKQALNRLSGIPPRSDNMEKEGRSWRSDSDSFSKLSLDGKLSLSSKTSSSGSSSSRSRKKESKSRKYQKIRSKHSDRTPTSTPSPCNSIGLSPQNSQGMPLSPPNQFNYVHEPNDLQKLGAAKPQVLPRGKMILFPPIGSSSRQRISPYQSVDDEGRTSNHRPLVHGQDGLSLFSRTHESNIAQAASAQYKKKLNEQVAAVVTPEKQGDQSQH